MALDGNHLSRRAFLVGAASTAVLAGCGSSDDGDDGVASATPTATGEAATSTPTGADGGSPSVFLVAGFADGLRTPPALVVGSPQRAPLFLVDIETNAPVFEGAPDTLSLGLFLGDEIVATTDVVRRGGDVGKAFYPLEFEVDVAGDYEARGDMDGTTLVTPFRVVERSEVAIPGVGDALIGTETPTFDDAREVDPICTRSPDPCPFHDRSLAELVGTAPVVLLISTPAYCQTAICGPVLELLIEAVRERDDLAVVHGEVWRNADVLFEPGGETELMTAYGMSYEPALFVADATGTITSRLDFTWDGDEMRTALATV